MRRRWAVTTYRVGTDRLIDVRLFWTRRAALNHRAGLQMLGSPLVYWRVEQVSR